MKRKQPSAYDRPPTEEHARGRKRSRRLVSGTLTALVSRGSASLAMLLMIPVTLGYLGAEVYGLWMTIASLAAMAMWADFGLGNGLLTRLAPCYARGDWDQARRYISSAYAVLGVTAGTFIAALWSLSGVIPWAAVFGVDDPALADLARATALVCLTAILVNIPVSLVQRVQYAYQQVSVSNLWQAAGSLGAVGAAWLAVQFAASPVVVVGCAVSGPVLGNLLASLMFYTFSRPRLAPRFSAVDRSLIPSLLQLASQFFVLSVVTTLALNVDNLLISHALDLEAVTAFSVPARIFMALGLMITLVNTPLWPANGEALARGDVAWVRRTTARMTWLSGGAVAAASLVLMVARDKVFGLIAGQDSLEVSAALAGALGAWWVIVATTSPRFMVQNAAGVVRPQLLGWLVYLGASVPLKWFAAVHFGIVGVPIVGAATYAACVWPGAVSGYRRTLAVARSGKSSPTTVESTEAHESSA